MEQALRLDESRTNRIRTRDAPGARPAPPPISEGAWEHERGRLLTMLEHQQRVAQAGLMTAGLAHDVNNHIQAVSGQCYLALMSEDPTRWREALEKVQQHCRDLSETADAFMTFLRRKKALKHEPFALSQAVADAHRIVAALAKKHGVALAVTLDGDGSIDGDKRLATQALVNLATNAVRACSATRGTVVFAVRTPTAHHVRVDVQDDGPGIPPELRQTLFQPFETGHAGKGGNGIGLYVVDQCVKKLGGAVHVRSSARGTTFTLEIPTANG